MKNYAIVTDSGCDLDTDIRKKYDIEYLKMYINYDEKEFPASLDWEVYSPKELYDVMRNGTRVLTAQITVQDYVEAFEKYLENGQDVLSISCSSALSGSFKASCVARDELLKKYHDRKIICIDALNSCLGEGLITILAAKMRQDNKTIEEVAEWIESKKLDVNQIATVEDLIYLKRAGRVTAASAAFGGLLQVKPILISDAKGQNYPIEKVKGRRASINRIVELTKELIINPAEQTLFVGHGDCITEAEMLKDRLINEVGCKDVYINYIGPIIGASTGPGTLGVYFLGKTVAINNVA